MRQSSVVSIRYRESHSKKTETERALNVDNCGSRQWKANGYVQPPADSFRRKRVCRNKGRGIALDDALRDETESILNPEQLDNEKPRLTEDVLATESACHHLVGLLRMAKQCLSTIRFLSHMSVISDKTAVSSQLHDTPVGSVLPG